MLLGLADRQVRRFDRTRILPEPEIPSREPRRVQVIAERIARDDVLQHRHASSRIVSIDEIERQRGRLGIDEERRFRLARERKPTFAQGSGLGSFLEVVIGRGHRGQALDHPSTIVQRLLDRECPLIRRKGLVVMTMRAVQTAQARQRSRQVAARSITGDLEPCDGQIEGFGCLRESSTRKQGIRPRVQEARFGLDRAGLSGQLESPLGELGALVVVSDKCQAVAHAGLTRDVSHCFESGQCLQVMRPCGVHARHVVLDRPQISVSLRQVLLCARRLEDCEGTLERLFGGRILGQIQQGRTETAVRATLQLRAGFRARELERPLELLSSGVELAVARRRVPSPTAALAGVSGAVLARC